MDKDKVIEATKEELLEQLRGTLEAMSYEELVEHAQAQLNQVPGLDDRTITLTVPVHIRVEDVPSTGPQHAIGIIRETLTANIANILTGHAIPVSQQFLDLCPKGSVLHTECLGTAMYNVVEGKAWSGDGSRLLNEPVLNRCQSCEVPRTAMKTLIKYATERDDHPRYVDEQSLEACEESMRIQAELEAWAGIAPLPEGDDAG